MTKSLLETLISGAQNLTTQGGLTDMTSKAKEGWNAQSTLTKGAIAGGLLGVLLSGNARRLVGTGVKVGGMAMIGGLAFKAYQDWQAGKTAGAEAATDILPAPTGDFAANDEELSVRLLQAMVAATKADGVVTVAERAAIDAQMATFGPDAAALLGAELDAPFDPNRIAGLARNPAEAAQIYAASLLAVDPNGPAEKGYLAMLAARLELDAGLIAHLHANA